MEEALSWNQAAGHTLLTQQKMRKIIFASKSLCGKSVPKPRQARSEFSAHKRAGVMCSSAVNGTASAILTPLTQFDRNDSQASCQFQLFADGRAAVNC